MRVALSRVRLRPRPMGEGRIAANAIGLDLSCAVELNAPARGLRVAEVSSGQAAIPRFVSSLRRPNSQVGEPRSDCLPGGGDEPSLMGQSLVIAIESAHSDKRPKGASMIVNSSYRRCPGRLPGRPGQSMPGRRSATKAGDASSRFGRHPPTGPSIPESEAPSEACSCCWLAAAPAVLALCPSAYPSWACVGAGSAKRAEGRRARAAGAGKRARRSAAQPGALMR